MPAMGSSMGLVFCLSWFCMGGNGATQAQYRKPTSPATVLRVWPPSRCPRAMLSSPLRPACLPARTDRASGRLDPNVTPASPPLLRRAGAQRAAALSDHRAGRLLNTRKQPFVSPDPDGCCGSNPVFEQSAARSGQAQSSDQLSARTIHAAAGFAFATTTSPLGLILSAITRPIRARWPAWWASSSPEMFTVLSRPPRPMPITVSLR